MRFTWLMGLWMVVACSGEDEKKVASPREIPNAKATRVETRMVHVGPAVLVLELPGEVGSLHDASLASPRGGYVERVMAKRGDYVRAGTSLAQIDSTAARADAARAEAEWTLAKTEMDVVLQAPDSVSNARRTRAIAQLKSAEANHALAKAMMNRSQIIAPFSGVVNDIDVEVGEVLAPGMRVARIVDVDHLKVSVSVSDRDIAWTKQGVDAVVKADGGRITLKTKVARVDAAADMETRTFIAELDVSSGSGLRPGMLVTVMLSAQAGQTVITIPQYALVTRGIANGVFVVKDGKAHWRDIVAGGLLSHDIIVEKGLQKGDEIVVRGHRELTEGDPVLVVRDTVEGETP